MRLIYVSENEIVNIKSIGDKKNIIHENNFIKYFLENKIIKDNIFESNCNYTNDEEIIKLLDYLSNKKMNKILINRSNLLKNLLEKMKLKEQQKKR
jgi:hypothetical protein